MDILFGANRPRSFQEYFDNPLTQAGFTILGADPSETTGQALLRGLQAAQGATKAKEDRAFRQEERDFQKKFRQRQEAQFKEEEETTALSKQIFGKKEGLDKLSDELISSGVPELVEQGIKFKNLTKKPSRVPKLQTVPSGTKSITGIFDPETEEFRTIFEAPRVISRGGGDGRRPTRDELLARELEGVDFQGMAPEEQEKTLRGIGKKLGRTDLLTKDLTPEEKKKPTTKAADINRKFTLFRNLTELDITGQRLLRGTDIPYSEQDFFERSDILDEFKSKNDVALTPQQEFEFFTLPGEEPATLLNSILEQKALQEAPVEAKTKEQTEIMDPLKQLDAQQREKLRAILSNPNILEGKKREILFNLGIQNAFGN